MVDRAFIMSSTHAILRGILTLPECLCNPRHASPSSCIKRSGFAQARGDVHGLGAAKPGIFTA